jgi:hypothetical protein
MLRGDEEMNNVAGTTVVPIKTPGAPRVRVKLRQATSQFSKVYPPDGQEEIWWERLKKALGTTSSDFVNATLVQIQNASRLPSGGVSETSVNAVLAFIEGAAPRDEVEAALAIQMACTHACTMAVLSRLDGAFGGDRGMAIRAAAAARLLKAFATQVEALRRLRNGGSQFVRVEHVQINDQGRAMIGPVSVIQNREGG